MLRIWTKNRWKGLFRKIWPCIKNGDSKFVILYFFSRCYSMASSINDVRDKLGLLISFPPRTRTFVKEFEQFIVRKSKNLPRKTIQILKSFMDDVLHLNFQLSRIMLRQKNCITRSKFKHFNFFLIYVLTRPYRTVEKHHKWILNKNRYKIVIVSKMTHNTSYNSDFK